MTDPLPLLVSVVTPSFNSETYLAECLESVQNQTHLAVEHVVADGGSTDATLDLLRRYSEVRVLPGPDDGMYDGLNKAIRASRGEVIACLNTDDAYLTDALAAVAAAFAADPALDVLVADALFVDERGVEQYRTHLWPFDWDRFVSLDFSSVVHPAVFWRRRVHDAIGYFDVRYRLAADFDFFARFRGLKVRRLVRPVCRFRLHSAAQTYRRQAESRAEMARILEGLGQRDDGPTRLRRFVGRWAFILTCYRPPLVLLRRALRRRWHAFLSMPG
jgi:glycosyltransferase involved in cell wall biosynthesis